MADDPPTILRVMVEAKGVRAGNVAGGRRETPSRQAKRSRSGPPRRCGAAPALASPSAIPASEACRRTEAAFQRAMSSAVERNAPAA